MGFAMGLVDANLQPGFGGRTAAPSMASCCTQNPDWIAPGDDAGGLRSHAHFKTLRDAVGRRRVGGRLSPAREPLAHCERRSAKRHFQPSNISDSFLDGWDKEKDDGITD
jgi:hypothetical protein